MNKKWNITKDLKNIITIDIQKREIRCDPKAWIRFETSDKIFIYNLGKEEAKK